MAWPTDFGTIPANAQGNTLVADIADDHALAHRQIGSILNSAGSKLGLSAGTPAVNQILTGGGNGSAAWGTSGTLLNFASSNFNNGILGTNLYQGGTHNNGVFGTPAITGGTFTGGTINKPLMDAINPTAQTYSPGSAGTATLDLSLANEHRITMPASGTVTLALTNDTNAQKFLVSLTWGAGTPGTAVFFNTIRWSGGTPTQTATAGKRDTFGFIRTGSSTYDGFIVGQNI